MAGRSIGRRQIPLQPKQFWNLHFRGDRAADIAENLIQRVVDLTGFGYRPMVHPDNDIASFVAGRTDRERIGGSVKHHERAGRIEPEALDSCRRNCRVRHRSADRGGTGVPDFRGRLFDNATRLVPNRDRVAGGCQQASLFVKYSGTRTRCSDVHADEGLPHYNPASDQRKLTSMYSLRQRERRSRSSGLRRRTPETERPRQSRRPPPCVPSACRRSRHRTSSGCS